MVRQLSGSVLGRRKHQPPTCSPQQPPTAASPPQTIETDDEKGVESNTLIDGPEACPTSNQLSHKLGDCADFPSISVTKSFVEDPKSMLKAERLLPDETEDISIINKQFGNSDHSHRDSNPEDTFVWLDWVAVHQQSTHSSMPQPPDLERVKAAILTCRQGGDILELQLINKYMHELRMIDK